MNYIQSISENGVNGTLIRVECSIANSLPGIVVVGFAHRSVDEARERIRSALAAYKIKVPRKRLVLNLAPADIPKQGSAYDLAMLVAILVAAKMVHLQPDDKTIILGELGLDGSIRPIKGILGKILAAQKLGITTFWLPEDNALQASLLPGITIYIFADVQQLYSCLDKEKMPEPYIRYAPVTRRAATVCNESLNTINGQTLAKRALMIAATGNHNLLLTGPPGTGKSMLAKALPELLPPLTLAESLEVTHIHSLLHDSVRKIIHERPFRAPHHTTAVRGMIGGGIPLHPGEISLCHNGVLMLDEFPEFKRPVIEALRQPLEDQVISVTNARGSTQFPARFLLVATANPCPCGYYMSPDKACVCNKYQIALYQKRLSGPVLDRIDLFVTLEKPDMSSLLTKALPSPAYSAQDVASLRSKQKSRAGKLNSELTNYELRNFAQPTKKAKNVLDAASERLSLSARSYIRVMRVARTIADIEGSEQIEDMHITEALQFRPRDSLSG